MHAGLRDGKWQTFLPVPWRNGTFLDISYMAQPFLTTRPDGARLGKLSVVPVPWRLRVRALPDEHVKIAALLWWHDRSPPRR